MKEKEGRKGRERARVLSGREDGPLLSSKGEELLGDAPILVMLFHGAGAGVPSSGRGGGTSRDTFQNVPPNSTTMSLSMREDATILPSPTSETVLTVAAFGVISFIVILVVVVIVLVGVVSLRFKCRKSKGSEDPQKPGSSGLSESCSTANGEKDRITLISMKNINMNNGKQSLSAEKVL